MVYIALFLITVKPLSDEKVFYDKFLCGKFTLPSVRVYAQHFLYDRFLCDKFFLPVCTSQQFFFDKFSLLTTKHCKQELVFFASFNIGSIN
jgi:hypothetical protein